MRRSATNPQKPSPQTLTLAEALDKYGRERLNDKIDEIKEGGHDFIFFSIGRERGYIKIHAEVHVLTVFFLFSGTGLGTVLLKIFTS